MTTYRTKTRPCRCCMGTGKVLTTRNVCGEAIDADWCEERCDYCDGEGELPAECAGCDRIEALDDEGFCSACIEPLTAVHGDPLRRVA